MRKKKESCLQTVDAADKQLPFYLLFTFISVDKYLYTIKPIYQISMDADYSLVTLTA